MNIAEYRQLKTKKRHKYNAKATVVDGIRFASKAEARRYGELKLLQKKGDVRFFLRQVPFHLAGNTKYICDFMIFWNDGDFTVEDCKGFETDIFKFKKIQVEFSYPITIKVVK